MNRLRIALCAAALIPGLAVGCSSAGSPESRPRTWSVTVDGGGDFATIQAAIDGASPGDTVLVGPGTYRGAGNRDLELRGKALVLRGREGPGMTVLECGGAPGEPHRGFYVHEGEGRETRIEGFSVTGGYVDGPLPANYGGGMLCVGSSPTVRDCRFVGNKSAHFGGGVVCHDGSSPLFEYVQILDNEAVNNAGGFGCKQGSRPELSWVVIAGNTAKRGGGVWCLNASVSLDRATIAANRGTESSGGVWSSQAEVRIERSIIALSPAGEAVSCSAAPPEVRLTCCVLFGNAGGDAIPDCAVDGGGNRNDDPLFCDAAGGDFRLAEGSPCLPDASECGQIGALSACDASDSAR